MLTLELTIKVRHVVKTETWKCCFIYFKMLKMSIYKLSWHCYHVLSNRACHQAGHLGAMPMVHCMPPHLHIPYVKREKIDSLTRYIHYNVWNVIVSVSTESFHWPLLIDALIHIKCCGSRGDIASDIAAGSRGAEGAAATPTSCMYRMYCTFGIHVAVNWHS